MMKNLLYFFVCLALFINQPAQSIPVLGGENEESSHSITPKKEIDDEESGHSTKQGPLVSSEEEDSPPIWNDSSSNDVEEMRRQASHNPSTNSEEMSVLAPSAGFSITRLICGDLSGESPTTVRKELGWALLETMGGILLFHFPHMIPLVHEDGNEPVYKNAVGYTIHGPEFREHHRSNSAKLVARGWGVLFLIDGARRMFGAVDEELNIQCQFEHRGTEIRTPSDRVDRHTRMFLRGALDFGLGLLVYHIHHLLMTALCPHIEEDIQATAVGGSYLFAIVLQTSLQVKGLITASFGGIQLLGDCCWDCYGWFFPSHQE